MKKLYIIICFLILLIFFQKAHSSFDKTVNNLQITFSCNREQAEKFMRYTANIMSEIQQNFSLISSNSTSKDDKTALINATITNFFVNSNASIYTNLKVFANKNLTIYEYLNTLSRNINERFNIIELSYRPNWLKMEKINEYIDQNDGNKYEFIIKAWRTFKCYNNGIVEYEDINLEEFLLSFYKGNNDIWSLKVEGIVSTTYANINNKRNQTIHSQKDVLKIDFQKKEHKITDTSMSNKLKEKTKRIASSSSSSIQEDASQKINNAIIPTSNQSFNKTIIDFFRDQMWGGISAIIAILSLILSIIFSRKK